MCLSNLVRPAPSETWAWGRRAPFWLRFLWNKSHDSYEHRIVCTRCKALADSFGNSLGCLFRALGINIDFMVPPLHSCWLRNWAQSHPKFCLSSNLVSWVGFGSFQRYCFVNSAAASSHHSHSILLRVHRYQSRASSGSSPPIVR